jgi:hypothetical protein
VSILTTNQIRDLTVIVLEECGPCLCDDELTEQIALLLENIAGFEVASEQVVRQVINEVRSYYHDASQYEADRDL